MPLGVILDSRADYDGYITRWSSTSWADARDNSVGTGEGSSEDKLGNGIQAFYYPSRGGSFSWRVYRSFLWFEVGPITEIPASATLKIFGYGNGDADFFAVQSTHSDDFAVQDFDRIQGWSAGVDNEGNVVKYSNEITSWSTSGYNSIALNSTALAHIESLDFLKICLIESVHDLRNVEPSLSTRFDTGLYYGETSRTPELHILSDTSTFFGSNF